MLFYYINNISIVPCAFPPGCSQYCCCRSQPVFAQMSVPLSHGSGETTIFSMVVSGLMSSVCTVQQVSSIMNSQIGFSSRWLNCPKPPENLFDYSYLFLNCDNIQTGKWFKVTGIPNYPIPCPTILSS